MMSRIVTLTTDFGEGSSYVAQLKGAIFSMAPQVRLVDLSHRISPQNVREGAIFLADVLPRFPEGALHLAVVDPGVGTSRAILLAEWRGGYLVGPDNGLFALLFQQMGPGRLYHLRVDATGASPTFHGRDLMAPAIGGLATGTNPADLGDEATGYVDLRLPTPSPIDQGCRGEVIFVDSFGNLITNIPAGAFTAPRERIVVEAGGRRMNGVRRTYGDAATGELIALVDSQNRLEIAAVNGSAANATGLKIGDAVTVTWPASGSAAAGK